jgi:two-component system chemotaxis response regulator CheY
MFRNLKPDLVTMDIVMPVMDGVEALRTIRDVEPSARVCMVSAVNQREKLAECIRLGAIDFIVKPFEKTQLISLFEKQGRRQ